MKKCFLWFCFFPFILCGQNEQLHNVDLEKLSVGLSIGPEYASRFTRSTDVYGDRLLEIMGKDETGKAAFHAGFSLDYELLPWLSFETGLLYVNKGYATGEITMRVDESDPGTTVSWKQNIHCLSVPLKAKFYVLGRRYPFFIAAGLSPDFFLGRSMKTAESAFDYPYYTDGGVRFNAVNLCGLVGVGTTYEVSRSLFLEAEVGFKSSMMPMNDEPLHRFLYSLGLDLRLYYRL